MPIEPSFIPQVLDEVTPEWLTQALQADGVLHRACVTGCTSEDLEGVGLIGSLARLRLAYDRAEAGAPATVIVKLPTPVAKNRAIGNSGDYEREVRFYQDLADTLPVRCPRCYVARFAGDPEATANRRLSRTSDLRFILLLEDMAPAETGDDVAGCGFERAALVLAAAARMHACFWEHPRLDDLWWLWRVGSRAAAAQQAYRKARAAFDAHYAAVLPPRVFQLLDWMNDHGTALHERAREPPRTLLHVDFRLDNVFFSDTTAQPEVTFFDWQAAGLGPAASDVAAFLGASLRDDVPPGTEQRLLCVYHDSLVEHGVADYPFDAFAHHYVMQLVLSLRSAVTNFSFVDWGDAREAKRRDLHLQRKVARLAHVEPDALLT